MKYTILAFLLLCSINSEAQYELSGLVFNHLSNPGSVNEISQPAMGSLVYVIPLKGLDMEHAIINKYLWAFHTFEKYHNGFKISKSRHAYSEMKLYNKPATQAFNKIMTGLKSVMVDAQGKFKIDNLKPGNYWVFFMGNLNQGKVILPPTVKCPIVEYNIDSVSIGNTDVQLNHIFSFHKDRY